MPIRISRELLAEGKRLHMYEIVVNDKQPVFDFICKQEKGIQSKLMARIRRIVDEGIPNNDEIFKHEEDGIWALKSGQIRIYCFFDSNRIILLTNCTKKKQRKADPQDLARAKRLRNDYFDVFHLKKR